MSPHVCMLSYSTIPHYNKKKERKNKVRPLILLGFLSYCCTGILWQQHHSLFFTFMGPCIILMYSRKTNKMQHYTVVFFTINALHVSGGPSAYHQELKTVYTASGICRASSASYHYREWVGTGLRVYPQTSSNSLDKYLMLCIQFWAPDDGRMNHLKHVEHL